MIDILFECYYYFMYRLFIDAVSAQGRICLSGNESLKEFLLPLIQGNESQRLGKEILSLLKEADISFSEIEHIYAVNGPGSFTAIRTICLWINTVAFVYPHITLTPISFFDLYDSYPIVKQSSKKDFFVQRKKWAIIEIIVPEQLFENTWIHQIYGSIDQALLEKYPWMNVESSYNIDELLKKTEAQTWKHIDPLYIKKPNIS